MALYLNTNHVLLLALVLLVPATSLAQTPATNIGIAVEGELYCTADGNPLPGAGGGAANATVTLRCGPLTNITARATNGQGEYNISVNVSADVAAIALTNGCGATVQLPVPSCSALNRTGTLQASLAFQNITNGVISLVPLPFVSVNATI